ncbi:MAG: DNA repair protein RadA [Acidaminobacter sp.]|uniref:DNA repair protein RadA n=1 Tax=Acidaminobacter sp. TaxID=1872102 RepID=UPI00137EB61C|nr:DNA repair protein RadA [Acidaminobacter sp.]MZQ96559.1 DNA repair protein RadA [Acidaminobacter sp.]
MSKNKTIHVCQNCGAQSPKWVGRCTECGAWNSYVEEYVRAESPKTTAQGRISDSAKPVRLIDVSVDREDRYTTGILELDNVLGGGVVRGSLVLVGGDPGIGKSTMLIQMADKIAFTKKKVLYVSGEESVKQTKLRADRTGVASESLYIISENDLEVIMNTVDALKPDVLIVDSIQTMFRSDIQSAPGSVSQVRECTASLMKTAKREGLSTFIVGHVTKSGAIAGPKVLEHMVDTVLYFEGERFNTYRLLRSVKNRFGSTNEIGVFEMTNQGLIGVSNPSKLFISEKRDEASGSVVVGTMEGTRPMLVEIQALVCHSGFSAPRRTAIGVDYNKVIMLIAVLEKKIGMQLQDQDSYINVVGGIRIDEPAADLGIIIALASSFKNIVINPEMMFFGEVGLTGEVRNVAHVQSRISEGQKLGFKTFVIPAGNLDGLEKPAPGVQIVGVRTVEEALDATLR